MRKTGGDGGRSGATTRVVGLLLLVVVLACGCSPVGAQQHLRILVTNDDGWESAGLQGLVAELAKLGEVVVSAPNENKSGSSQSSSPMSALRVERVEIAGATQAYAVWGSPAVAATFGVLTLGRDQPFDVLVSGINVGGNVGATSHISGTVGAAMQATMLGVPALAVSQDGLSRDYGLAARYTAKLVTTFADSEWPAGVVLSVNVPAAAVEAENPLVEVLPMGNSLFHFEGFEQLDGDEEQGQWRVQVSRPKTIEPGTDTASYLAGNITVTPLFFDWSARGLVEPLRGVVPQP